MALVAKQPDHLMFYKPHSDAQKKFLKIIRVKISDEVFIFSLSVIKCNSVLLF